jgi:hypothetical protein
MLDDKIKTLELVNNMLLYNIISQTQYDDCVMMINNETPFQIYYFINGKLKSIDYLMESTETSE